MKQGVATVADAWRPTSELERRLHESVRAGDQEGYFRVLADSELVVPVPPDAVDDVLANEAQPTWPTREEDGRVHVLTYTSAAAMRACLGPAYRHFMTVRFGDIAQSWPDAGWWLAVDAPGNDVTDIALPIEARLPSWFVRQVAEGDGRPPRVGRPGAGGADGPWEELRGQHRELPRETRRPEFQPANDVERELLRAAANNDHDLFLQTLAGTEVLLPVPEDTDYALRPGRPGFPWQTRDVDGATVVPVFTSPERLIEAARAAGTGTEYIRLPFTVALRYWPHPDWQLAINSGSPAGGTVQAQQLPGLATWADQRAAQRMTDGFEPQNDVEQRLFDAARRRDTDTFYKVLLGAQVLVPADPDTPWGITPDDSGFPWHPVDIHGRPSIQVFTSLKWMNDALNSSRFVMPTLLDMVAAWPDASWTFVLNPGTPIDASMPGDKMRGLAGPPRAVPEDPATRPSAATPPPPDAPAVPVSPPVPAADGPVDAHTSAEPPLPGDTAEATSMHGAEAAGVRGETGLPSGNLPPAAAGHGAGMPDAPASPSEDGRTGPRGRDDQAPDAPTDTPPPAPLTNAPGADLASGPLPPASLGAGHAAPNHGAGTPGADETTGLPSGPLPPDTTAAGPSDRAPDATTGSTPADPLTNEAPGARGETTPDAHTPTGLSNEPLPPAPLAAGNAAPNPGEDPNTRGDGTPGADGTTGLTGGPQPPDTTAAGPSDRAPDAATGSTPADPLTSASTEATPGANPGTGLASGPLPPAPGARHATPNPSEDPNTHGEGTPGTNGTTGLPSGPLPPDTAAAGPGNRTSDTATGPAPADPLTNEARGEVAPGDYAPTGLTGGPLPSGTTAAGPSDRTSDATTSPAPSAPLTNEAPGARGETTPDAHTPTGLSNEPLPPAPLAAGNSAPNPGEDPNTRGDGTPGTDETTGLPSGPLPPDTAAAGPSNRTPDTAMRPEPADPLTNEARGEVAPTGLTGGPLVGAHGDTGPQAGSAMPGAFVDGPGGRGEGAPSGGPFDPLSGVGATDAPSAGGEAPSAAHGPHPGAAADDTGARDLAARPVGASFSSTTSGDAPSPRGEGTLGAAPSVPLTADGRTGPDATDASVDGPGTRGEGTPSAGPSTDVPDTHGETLPTQASTNLPDGSPGASVDGPGGEGTSSAEPSVPPALGGYADLGATGDPSVRGEPAWPGAGPADAPGEWAPRTGTAPSDPLAADHLNPRGEGATGAERPVGEPAWPGAEATNAPGAPASPDPAAIDDRERAGEHGHLSPGPGDDAGVPAADEPRRLAAYGSPSEPEGAEHDRPGAAGVPDGGDPTRTAIDSLGTRVAPTRSGADPEGGEHPPEDAGGHGLRAVPEAEPVFEPGNRIDQELYEATLTGDSDAFLRVLLNANVLVPIPDGAPLEATPVQRDFRWDAALRDDSSVRVFTSLVRLREVLPEARFVYADFRELIGVWPRADWAMLLNPGTRIGASLRGEQVQALSEWAVRVGLVQARPEVPLPPPRQPEPEPVVRQEPRPVADPDDRVSQLAIMQKVVPHGHVGWYLEQGYDRIGGFVHLTSDVAELQTPAQLYEALGLLYDDSPFSPADEGVYVIRWPAYCPDIYRVPFGGQSEDEMAAWGESGWVVERPPFVGSGFAPGSAGSIREFKVDSVRLPYGSEMYLLGTDRSERFVAMYDPDRLGWLRPEPDGRTEAAQ